jgi:flagellar biosynthesis protein
MNRVVNPPDIAVALHYDGQGAPRVTAKGKGAVADQIIELAREHDIPLHTDAGLVTVLSQIPLGEEIPRELYLAIAEVIAFAYYLSGKRPDPPAP